VFRGQDAADAAFSRSRSKRITSIKCFKVTMFTTPLPETFGALQRVYRAVDRYRRKMLRSRSWGEALTNASDQIKQRFPLLRQNCIQLCEAKQLLTSDECSAGNPHATIRGSRGLTTASAVR